MFRQLKELRLGSLLPFSSKGPDTAKEGVAHEPTVVTEVPQKVPPKRRGQGPRTVAHSGAYDEARYRTGAEDREQRQGGAAAGEDREQRLRRLRMGGAATKLSNSIMPDSRPSTSQPVEVLG